MIKFEKTEVVGFESAIRGMRNPMNSWDRSDSCYGCKSDNFEGIDVVSKCDSCSDMVSGRGYLIGPNDKKLMVSLAKNGSVHAKYRRMINVYVDITAPLYWWKEYDTYKVGTVANSCSTMHKIHEKEFTLEDFSHENLSDDADINTIACCPNPILGYSSIDSDVAFMPLEILNLIILSLNTNREAFISTGNKKYWWNMIQMLPSSYNQKRTVMLSYEVLAGILRDRSNHKLDEWVDFCYWIKKLPYSNIISSISFLEEGDD